VPEQPKPSLRCDTCNVLAVGDLAIVAKLGGTHWRILTHAVGIPGHKGSRQARSCGKWVEQEQTGDSQRRKAQ